MKAAVIGLGFVGMAHVEALLRAGVPVQGILTRSPAKARLIAERYGNLATYADLEELLRDDQVSSVHVCTPNFLHFDQVKAALVAGKHVLCEKPLAMNSQETAELVDLAQEAKRVGAVCYSLRYYPLCQHARSLIRSGAIGDVRLVHGAYLQDWLFDPTDWNWRVDAKLGGQLRAVGDIGTHWMDMVMWLTGKRITQVCADLATLIPHRRKALQDIDTFEGKLAKPHSFEDVAVETEDYATVMVHLEGGSRGAFTVSQICAGRKNRFSFEINGSKASVAWNGETPNHLWIGERNRPNSELIKDPSLISPIARRFAAYPGGHAEGYPDTFVQLFKEFYHFLSERDLEAPRPFPTFENGHYEAVLCEAIAESARRGSWIRVPDQVLSY